MVFVGADPCVRPRVRGEGAYIHVGRVDEINEREWWGLFVIGDVCVVAERADAWVRPYEGRWQFIIHGGGGGTFGCLFLACHRLS